jgi:RNA polymerase sigma-70 factor (ECF subfamily)
VAASEAELKVLMLAALAADRAAYRTLLGHLRRRLEVFFGRRLTDTPADVDDLVQETLIAIHAKRETFDRSQAFTPWAYAIARYKLVDHFRRTRHGTTIPLDYADEVFVEDGSAAVDARRDVERALALLPERSRAVLRSVKLDGLSTAEAAARHGLSESAVKVGVHRSLRRLAAQLRGAGKADE